MSVEELGAEPIFKVTFDPGTGIVACRIAGALSGEDARALVAEMREVTARGRREAPRLRFLFDHSRETVSSSGALETVIDQLRGVAQPGDRSAVLVSNSLEKVHAKRLASAGSGLFVSESAAMTWLNAF